MSAFTRKLLFDDLKQIFPHVIHPKAELELANILNEWVRCDYLMRTNGRFYTRGRDYRELASRHIAFVRKVTLSLKEKGEVE